MLPPSNPTPANGPRLSIVDAAGRPSAKAPHSTDLFDREVERAIERQGGKVALDERLARNTNARRAGRRAGFDEYSHDVSARKLASRRNDTSDRRDDGAPLEGALRSPVDANEPRARVETAEDGHGAEATRAGGECPGGEQRRASSASRSASADANANAGAPIDARTTGASSAFAGAPTTGADPNAALNANGAGQQRVGGAETGAPRPVDATQAFLQGARSDARGAATKAAAPPPAADAELIEHAAEVLKQIRLSLKGAANEVTVQLTPAELGRLSIRMRLNEGRLSTVVRAESRQTLELLERQLPELRAVLAQQGFETERLDLELGFENAFLGDAHRGGDDASRSARSDVQPSGAASVASTDDVGALPASTTVRLSEDGVDTYA